MNFSYSVLVTPKLPTIYRATVVVSRDDALGRVYKVLLTWTGLFGDSAPVAAELHDAGPTCFFDHASDLKFDQRFETYCTALALWRFFAFRARRRKQVVESLKLDPTDSTVSETQRLGLQVNETAANRSAVDNVSFEYKCTTKSKPCQGRI